MYDVCVYKWCLRNVHRANGHRRVSPLGRLACHKLSLYIIAVFWGWAKTWLNHLTEALGILVRLLL